MKKFLLLLSVFVMCALTCLTANATVTVPSTAKAIFTMSSATCYPGETVEVTISLDSSEKINSIALSGFTYDTEVLEFVGFSDYENSIKNQMIFDIAPDADKMALTIPLKSATVLNEKLCTMTFKIKSNAAEGTYTVSATPLTKNGSTVVESFVVSADIVVKLKENPISVTGISLNKTSATLTEGESFALTATVTPSNATNKNVVWTSSDTSVATVTSAGVVAARSAGTATITAKTSDGGKTASCVVTVKEKTILVTGISLDKTSATLTVGENLTLTATVVPNNATNKAVTWKSSDTSIAIISNGVVTAKKAGTVTITATTVDGNRTANCTVTVKAKTYTVNYDANGGSGAPASQTKIHGENLTLSTVKPVRDGYTFKGWATSSSGSVAYGRGAVYKADSSVTLYAVWEKEAVSVSGISLNKTSATLTAGESLALTATVTPSNATNKNVVWTSSDTSVATVTSLGVVTAKSAGTATITAKTSDGGKTATCVITVNKAYDTNALTFSISSAKVLPGKTLKINLNISNNKGFAGAKFVIWYDNSVMTLKGYETNWPGNCESKFNDDASYVPVAFVFGRTTDWKANQTLLTLEFKIKEDAPLGEYDLVFTADRNVNNERRQNVDANFVGGKIEIVDSTPGDVNGDGYINTKDAVLLAQHLAEWEVDVDLVGADCNRDGNIDTKDAVLLAQYLAEWKVTLG